jgi:hypothetical protein
VHRLAVNLQVGEGAVQVVGFGARQKNSKVPDHRFVLVIYAVYVCQVVIHAFNRVHSANLLPFVVLGRIVTASKKLNFVETRTEVLVVISKNRFNANFFREVN